MRFDRMTKPLGWFGSAVGAYFINQLPGIPESASFVVPWLVGLAVLVGFLHELRKSEVLSGVSGGRLRLSACVTPATLAAFAIFGVLFTVAYASARQAGFVGYITMQGTLVTRPGLGASDVLVQAFLDGSDASVGETRTDPNGYFSFTNLYRAKYRFLALRPVGEAFYISEFTRDLRANPEVEKDYTFPLATYRAIARETAYFESGVDQLDQYTRDVIERFGDAATDGLALVLWVGHADQKGSPGSNYDLGLARAREVARAGRENFGLDLARHYILSRGESEPADAGTTPDALARNRRVEVYALVPVFDERQGLGHEAVLNVSLAP